MSWLATAVNGIDLNPFLQFGAVGAIAAMGLVFMWQAYKREQKRADDNEAEVKRLNQAIIDKYLVAQTESMHVLNEVADMLNTWREPPAPPPPRRRAP